MNDFVYLGIAAVIIGIIYNVQTWRFPEKESTRKQRKMARGDSIFLLVLGFAMIGIGFFL
jgi:prepilin signal peptidase PulO-like enzyme (type II secretory pathway)